MPIDAFLKILNRLPEATLLVTGGGVVLGANRRLARLGVTPEELLGKRLSDVTTQLPDSLSEYLLRCARTAEPVPGAINLMRDDGTTLLCRCDGSLLTPRSGESNAVVVLRLIPKDVSIGHFVTLNQKIGELGKEVLRRTKLEGELREQKERLAVTLASIGDAVIATDTAGRVVLMNAVAESLCGWLRADAIGKPLQDVFHIVNGTTRLLAESPVEHVLREGRVQGLANHTILIGRHKKETPIEDSAAPIIDARGEVSGVVLVFRDVAEKRRAQELKERLAAIVESSDDIIVSKNLDGIITSWNKGAERILGYTAEEVIGKHISILMPPDNKEDTERILVRIRRGQKVDHYETRRQRKDGTIIDVSLTVSPIRNADGEIIGASKIGRNITEQKLIETERQEADRRKDEFLAMLAHELRNPLASINSAIQLFGRLETEQDLEWAKDVVQRQVKHLGRLIDDLLDDSRITRGKISLRKEALDLSPVVSGAVEAVRPLIEERKHELSISLAGTLRLESDPLRLEQILVNLLTNAAKYTDAGGHIDLSARHEGDDIVIKIRDTGVGISLELMPHIFDLFVQGDRTIARSEGGLGIGLTLVKSLAEMHGGSITVASEGPGKGTEFTVRLPALKTGIRETSKPTNDLPRVTHQRSRVLIVDDNADTARGVSKLLKLFGHDVQTAFDGPTAIEVARAYKPEIVLLDIGLPGMDGYEVVRQLRKEDCCKDALIVAVSGYGQEDDRRRSGEAGFDQHLVKPLDYDALMSVFA